MSAVADCAEPKPNFQLTKFLKHGIVVAARFAGRLAALPWSVNFIVHDDEQKSAEQNSQANCGTNLRHHLAPLAACDISSNSAAARQEDARVSLIRQRSDGGGRKAKDTAEGKVSSVQNPAAFLATVTKGPWHV
jgi:hypothetical protein